MPHEFVVFLPYGSDPNKPAPLDTARALIAHLNVGRAEVGQDVLTGGVEMRFYYDARVLADAKAWLREKAVLFDVSVL